jgi:hypothetical protein
MIEYRDVTQNCAAGFWLLLLLLGLLLDWIATALHHAICKDVTEVVCILLDNGVQQLCHFMRVLIFTLEISIYTQTSSGQRTEESRRALFS